MQRRNFMEKLSLRDLPIEGKKVLMRVDFNVPLENGKITDDSRIVASLPSIRYILDHEGSLVLMSHLGRPKGNVSKEFSLAPCAKRLGELLNKNVIMAPDCIGPEVERLVQQLKPGEILMLENLRFHPGEEKPKDHPDFVRALAKLGDLYVNDAFGTAHRFHASTAAITQYFEGKAAAGLLLEKEIQFLGEALKNPKKPFYAIVGGAKISTKMGVLKSLLKKADCVIVGGAMAYTFFKAKGYSIGNSLFEPDQIEEARSLLEESKKLGVPLLLPLDTVITHEMKADAITKIVDITQGIPDGWEGVDIGPKTIELFSKELQKAKTILWNGPLGVFEIEQFAKGTRSIAETLGKLNATTIIGGGDSLAAIQAVGLADKMSHLSTGGGASLEYIEFGTLPGIEALSPKKS